jgi:parallel beta-helix repeat protein
MQSHNQYIEDNDFHDNTEFGLQLYNGSGNNLRIRRNKLNRNPVGIRIEESAGTLLECNDVSANTSESLRLTPSVTSYTIRNNDFRGAAATLDSGAGTYTNNCEDGNGITTCLSTCP